MLTVIGNTEEKNVSFIVVPRPSVNPVRISCELQHANFLPVCQILHSNLQQSTKQVRDLTEKQALELEKARTANAAFVERMKHLVEKQ